MSDTTGWHYDTRCDYYKVIDGDRYEIHKGRDGLWWVWLRGRVITRKLTIAEAQWAAHDHAR